MRVKNGVSTSEAPYEHSLALSELLLRYLGLHLKSFFLAAEKFITRMTKTLMILCNLSFHCAKRQSDSKHLKTL